MAWIAIVLHLFRFRFRPRGESKAVRKFLLFGSLFISLLSSFSKAVALDFRKQLAAGEPILAVYLTFYVRALWTDILCKRSLLSMLAMGPMLRVTTSLGLNLRHESALSAEAGGADFCVLVPQGVLQAKVFSSTPCCSWEASSLFESEGPQVISPSLSTPSPSSCLVFTILIYSPWFPFTPQMLNQPNPASDFMDWDDLKRASRPPLGVAGEAPPDWFEKASKCTAGLGGWLLTKKTWGVRERERERERESSQ